MCVTVTVSAERDGVPRAAARADEVGRDHRLAVPRRERVQRTPAERREQEQQQDALRRPAASANTRRSRRRAARPRAVATGVAVGRAATRAAPGLRRENVADARSRGLDSSACG